LRVSTPEYRASGVGYDRDRQRLVGGGVEKRLQLNRRLSGVRVGNVDWDDCKRREALLQLCSPCRVGEKASGGGVGRLGAFDDG
jgi:hypothetical protein